MPYTCRDATEGDLAIYLRPAYQGKGLGIETLTATIFASNTSSIALFEKMGFERWGFMPRVARLEGVENDMVLVGKRLVTR